MTHVSRKKLPNKVLRQILDSFLFVLTSTKKKEEMSKFLDAFLSNTEKIMLAKRLAIVFLLSEAVEETKISETLLVTQSTVSRIKLWYETKGSGYKIAITKLKKQKLLGELKLLALEVARRSIRAAGGRP
ncbi:hypothetical protein COU95_00690 [Candidatus Shapirobacteria bacterium CG10_big_fil_rev_8_21_14_0_10_40_9]|uniref:TrpR like protein, YerC/YecD n=1 Tax=Candidatus Shapirobacteria bacterium CG10_big_fil_rev_8_21_14_0_10_40_9 TaxID=1974888 RepID=A0A2M8L4G3_9BACT|nr:MAG: hypothetical protein COU95_00690 [Candidatus Shapirobacteria bacterium CG10_big_fil_rev_8_21_14_0_10_40_9]